MDNSRLIKCEKSQLSYYLENSCKNINEARFCFIHGFGGNSLIWQRFIEKLVIEKWCSVDLLGHGKSNTMPLTTIEQLFDTFQLFVTSNFVPMKQVSIIAHSLGGMITLRHLIEKPHYFSRAFLLSTDVKINLHPEMVSRVLNKTVGKEFIKTWFSNNVEKPIEIISKSFDEININSSNENNFLLMNCWSTLDLTKIASQCYLFAGEHDKIISPRRTRKLSLSIPYSEFFLLENVGHYAFVEGSNQLIKIIRDIIHHETSSLSI